MIKNTIKGIKKVTDKMNKHEGCSNLVKDSQKVLREKGKVGNRATKKSITSCSH